MNDAPTPGSHPAISTADIEGDDDMHEQPLTKAQTIADAESILARLMTFQDDLARTRRVMRLTTGENCAASMIEQAMETAHEVTERMAETLARLRPIEQTKSSVAVPTCPRCGRTRSGQEGCAYCDPTKDEQTQESPAWAEPVDETRLLLRREQSLRAKIESKVKSLLEANDRLAKERNALIKAVAEHITVRADYRDKIDQMGAALERLGSMEAFVTGRMIDQNRDEELLARIDHARGVLAGLKARDEQLIGAKHDPIRMLEELRAKFRAERPNDALVEATLAGAIKVLREREGLPVTDQERIAEITFRRVARFEALGYRNAYRVLDLLAKAGPDGRLLTLVLAELGTGVHSELLKLRHVGLVTESYTAQGELLKLNCAGVQDLWKAVNEVISAYRHALTRAP